MSKRDPNFWSISLLNSRVCANDFAVKALEYKNILVSSVEEGSFNLVLISQVVNTGAL